MAKTAAFEAHPHRYDEWFDRHWAAYLSELLAVRAFVPWCGLGLEIGVGSGRFAAPLGVQIGIDPAPAMRALAAARGIQTVEATAECLPFPDAHFDHALLVTTLCYLDSPAQALDEARRVLRPGGRLVIAFIDCESPLGQSYLARKDESVFYEEATFHSAREVEALLVRAGFEIRQWGQTLADSLLETRRIEALRPGRGDGAFVIVSSDR